MEQMRSGDLALVRGIAAEAEVKQYLSRRDKEVLKRVADAAEQYLELSNAVTWQTSCLNCSKLLDRLSSLDLAVLKLLEDNPELRDDPRFADIIKARE